MRQKRRSLSIKKGQATPVPPSCHHPMKSRDTAVRRSTFVSMLYRRTKINASLATQGQGGSAPLPLLAEPPLSALGYENELPPSQPLSWETISAPPAAQIWGPRRQESHTPAPSSEAPEPSRGKVFPGCGMWDLGQLLEAPCPLSLLQHVQRGYRTWIRGQGEGGMQWIFDH